jgi:uncharacterized 2Fe-2S/4Fe-4S cluster protein (DUF4445 family)
MIKDKNINLLIDIGTNGEIVLGCADWMYACSTAAGPAFEGANIKCGMGGADGAIDSVKISRDVEFTTIGGTKAKGICGSGLVSLIAGLLKAGVIDKTGRLRNAGELENIVSDELKGRLVNEGGLNSFLIAKGVDNDGRVIEGRVSSSGDIVLTQKDIREAQNAKAAIAAGIQTLLRRGGIDHNQVAKVYLAGGFGNYIDKESAVQIGLIPKELGAKVVAVGNAAGAGAVVCLLAEAALKEASLIKDRIEYIELSASPDFADEYVQNMIF